MFGSVHLLLAARAAVAKVQGHSLGVLARCRFGSAAAEPYVLQERVGDRPVLYVSSSPTDQ
jgi:hypothetical protein